MPWNVTKEYHWKGKQEQCKKDASGYRKDALQNKNRTHGLQKKNKQKPQTKKTLHSAKALRLLGTEVMSGKFTDGSIDNDR